VQFQIGAVLQHSNTPSLRVAGFEDEDENEAPHEHPYPLRGCNSDLAQYSNTPSLRAAGFEDEDDDEDENEAPGEGDRVTARPRSESAQSAPGLCY
jgi:hypothetical protein